MNVAGPSTIVLRCCQRSPAVPSLGTVAVASASTLRFAKSRAKTGSKHKTPPGTNAKGDPHGRPKRDDTTYGIPPLHPSLYLRGKQKLSQADVERAQRPDFEAIWAAERSLAVLQDTEPEYKKAAQKLHELRSSMPKRHPLWAFFHEKTAKDAQDEVEARRIRREKTGHTATEPDEFSLAYALEPSSTTQFNSGRPWTVEELRRKSFDDLHKLWYILLVERNVLATQRAEAKRAHLDVKTFSHILEYGGRLRKSMARIKYTLNERRRAAEEAQAILQAAAERHGTDSLTDTQQAIANQRVSSFTEPGIAPVAPALAEQRAAS